MTGSEDGKWDAFSRAYRRSDGGYHEPVAKSVGAHAMKVAVCNRRHGVTLVRELTTTPKRTRLRQHVARA